MTVAKKLLATSLLGIALVAAVFVYVNHRTQTALIENAEDIRLREALTTFQAMLEDKGGLARGMASSVASMPSVRSAFSEGRRRELLSLLLPIYRELSPGHRVVEIAAHLPPATAFLRVSDPERFGDDESSYLSSVVWSNSDKSQQSGIEVLRSGFGVAGVAPVTHEGVYVGTISFVVGLDSFFLEQFKARTNADVSICVTEEALGRTKLAPSPGHAVRDFPEAALLIGTSSTIRSSVNLLRSGLEGKRASARLETPRGPLMAGVIPLRAHSGAVVGVVEVQLSRGAVLEEIERSRNTSILLGAILGAAALFAFWMLITSIVVTPLGILTLFAEELKSGNRASRVTLNSRDEIGRLGSAFNAMADEIDGLVTGLEQRVAERTEKLNDEIAERSRAQAALRESEGNFRAIFDSVNEAILVADAQTLRIVQTNRRASELFGFAEEEFPLLDAERLSEAVPPFTGAEALVHMRKALEGAARSFEWRSRRKDGSLFWSDVNIRRAKIGDRARLLISIQDVTGRKDTEEAKAFLEQQLSQSQKMEAIGTLAGGIAHDFNNILAAIVGYSELALSRCTNDRQKEFISAVITASGRATDLVRQILSFSRASSEEARPVRVKPLVKEALKLLRASIPVTVEFRQKIASDGVVLAEPGDIHRIMINLCTNAGLAMAEKGGVLEVELEDVLIDRAFASTHPDLRPGPYVRLTVRDTGCGMTSEVKARIFDPFFTTRPKGEGTGMGLSVVHGLVRSRMGAIFVETGPGRGTAFHLYFPAEARDGEVETASLDSLPVGCESILFVDDEEMISKMTGELLSGLGYKVRALTSATDALAVFTRGSEEFDLVITDYAMPGMSGEEFARRVWEIRPGMPVVLCSGFSERIGSDNARELGFADFLLKPVSIAVFSRAIRDVLGDNV